MPTAMAPHPFRQAMEARDLDAAMACFTPDAVLRSPITNRIKFRGRQQLTDLFGDVLAVLEKYSYVDEWDEGEARILRVQSVVRGQDLELVQILRLDDDGMVREIALFGRPLTGTAALLAALAPRVAGRRGRLQGLLGLGVRPLVGALLLTDRLSVSLASPRA